MDRDQLLPGAGRGARRPGGRHRRGARLARRPAPGPARDGGARRLAVRLLHAGLRVLHGRGVLPRRPGGHQRHRSRTTDDTTATTASTCTRSAATCAAAPATGRSRTPPSRSASPAADDALAARRTTPAPAPRADPAGRRRGDVPPARRRSPRPSQLLATTPDAVVVAGSTDWGVEVNLKGRRAGARGGGRPAAGAARLRRSTDDEVRIGAALTLTEIERRLDGRLPLLAALMPQFASPLIRNGATLGGNLGTGSPIGDAPPVLLALEASVVLASTPRASGPCRWPTTSPATASPSASPDELITEVVVPLPAARADGVPQDRQAALRRHLVGGHRLRARRRRRARSRKARIGLGGVAATPIRALATEAALEGRPWTPGDRRRGRRGAGGRGHPDRRPAGQRRVPGGDARPVAAEAVRRAERRQCTTSTGSAERPDDAGRRRDDAARERGAARHRPRALHRRPRRAGPATCLHAHPVQAPHAHARVTRLDPAPAYDVPGVVRVLTADDVPGRQRRRHQARRAAVPDRGHVPRPRGLLGARRVARGGPARCAGGRGRLRAAAGAA